MHTPVLLKDVIEALNIIKGGLYIDATAGEGGHLLEILNKGGRVLALDRDKKQIENLELRIKQKKNLVLKAGNFADIEKIAKENNFYPVDGILFDLGLSMRQLTSSGKGLSYKNLSESLDMRGDESQQLTAADLINNSTEKEIYEILAKYSEEINSSAIARAIVRARRFGRLDKVNDLIRVINAVVGPEKRVCSRVFQALRIVVNDEMGNLKKGLQGAMRLLKNKGRIAVITFHSLEDRVVKNFIKDNGLKLLIKTTSKRDQVSNFERSARLRVFT